MPWHHPRVDRADGWPPNPARGGQNPAYRPAHRRLLAADVPCTEGWSCHRFPSGATIFWRRSTPQWHTTDQVHRGIYDEKSIYTPVMTKRLVDIDDQALAAAQAALGRATIKATVNEALRIVGGHREEQVATALDILAASDLADRSDAWR